MRKLKYLLFLFLFFIFFDVKALNECTTLEMSRLKELASNVEFKYDYRIEQVKLMESDLYSYPEVYYSVTALNLNDDLKVYMESDPDYEFTNLNPTIDGLINGTNIKIKIIAYTSNLCSGKIVLTKNISLPYYNLLSEKEECKTYKDFKYCQEFGRFSITDEEFYHELEEYKKETPNNSEDNSSDNKKIYDYFNEYKYYIFGVVGIIFLLIMILIIKKNKKKDRDL